MRSLVYSYFFDAETLRRVLLSVVEGSEKGDEVLCGVKCRDF